MKYIISVAALFLYFSGAGQSLKMDKGIVYYKLGNDTINVQYFEYSKSQFKTTIVQFSGGITKSVAEGYLDSQGDIAKVNSTNYQLDRKGGWLLSSTDETMFKKDSTFFISTNSEGKITRRRFADKGIVVNGMSTACFFIFPYIGFAAPSKNGDTLFHNQLSGVGKRAFTVTRFQNNKLRAGSNLMGYMQLNIDKKGRLLSANAIGSSLNFVADVNRDLKKTASVLDDLAQARFKTGATISRAFRDTTTALINNKKIEIDYWRPYRRGREIFGSVVPWGKAWRTGANNATQLRTEARLKIGGVEIEVGKYGIWTTPDPQHWELIINKNATAWGTDYNQSADVCKVPMKVTRLTAPVEILKISLVPIDDDSVSFVVEWDLYSASVVIDFEK